MNRASGQLFSLKGSPNGLQSPSWFVWVWQTGSALRWSMQKGDGQDCQILGHHEHLDNLDWGFLDFHCLNQGRYSLRHKVALACLVVLERFAWSVAMFDALLLGCRTDAVEERLEWKRSKRLPWILQECPAFVLVSLWFLSFCRQVEALQF